MRKIQIKIINPEILSLTRKLAAVSARLTQHGENINTVKDFERLYDEPISDNLLNKLTILPHPNLLKHTMLSVVIVGASRRFLAQITRHQDGVNFTSASCQYSDWSNNAQFVVPLSCDIKDEEQYINNCKASLDTYKQLITNNGLNHDDAAYVLPQGLRNVIIVSANIHEWQHIISQRSCNRNTSEMQYIILKIWKELYKLDPILFSRLACGPWCMKGKCKEGPMSCNNPMSLYTTPDEILEKLYDKA